MAPQRGCTAARLSGLLLVVPAFLLAAAAPAAAATGTLTPNQDQIPNPIDRADPINFSATARKSCNVGGTGCDTEPITLSITVPTASGPSTRRLRTHNEKTQVSWSYQFDPDYLCAPTCSGQPARNGQYTVTLAGRNLNQSRTLTVRVPPVAPTSVSATKTGQRQITVRWRVGALPDDAVGFDVYHGNVLLTRLYKTELDYAHDLPETGYGGSHTYRVAAIRGDGAGGELATSSAPSNTVTLTEPTPSSEPTPTDDPSTPSPDPSASPSPGTSPDPGASPSPSGGFGSGGTPSPGTSPGSSPGSGSGSGSGNNGGFSSGGSATPKPADKKAVLNSQRQAFALTFKSFSPKLGAPKLPPLPAFAPVPEDEGTFDDTIDYGEQEIPELAGSSTGGSVREVAIDTIVTVFQGRNLYTSVAAGLLMVLCAAHLRVWLGSAPE